MNFMKNDTYTTKSSEETEELGKKLAAKLKEGDIIFLYGELGAGKTTFVKGIAKGLGIKERIISPTFVIIRKHKISNIKYQISNIKYFYHIDLYRIEDENNVKSLGLEDLLRDKDSILVIEWPEKISSKSIVPAWEIKFEYIDGNKRRIIIKDQLSKIKYQKQV
ncbi:tRNA (adenosine(37)-N6)-threonylcarbamoyltransferase complex ATPase subunit type 1 TsaE [Candidatus Parcubacteria bacterium]|nr:MAG: tRNA (adenosine(37)-N6)-threonylcarbamoyltransferase complex ATPase subunit type 1 TsaE [Candidatus Parcubacteria bacterium]